MGRRLESAEKLGRDKKRGGGIGSSDNTHGRGFPDR